VKVCSKCLAKIAVRLAAEAGGGGGRIAALGGLLLRVRIQRRGGSLTWSLFPEERQEFSAA
jgi:hypothetical protein